MSEVESIALQQGAKGDYFKLKIGGKTFSAWPDLDVKTGSPNNEAFLTLQAKEIKVGDNVEVDFKVNTGPGKDNTTIEYKNLVSIKKISSENRSVTPSVPQSSTISQSVWDEKDLRIVAQNALSHADEFRSIQQLRNKEVSEEEYFAFAQKCVDWVYGQRR